MCYEWAELIFIQCVMSLGGVSFVQCVVCVGRVNFGQCVYESGWS